VIATALSTTSEPLMDHWRGRIGLTAPEVRSIYSDSKLKSVEDSTSIKQKKKKSKLKTALGDPVELTFMTYDEEEIKVVGYEGETLMEVGVRNDFETIQAQCGESFFLIFYLRVILILAQIGGHCECATCHVHVIPPEPGSSLESSLSLPLISEEEEDQLEFAMGRRDDSRLSCQIVVTKQLGQYVIELPQY
jgi:ferredoxin